MHHLTDRIAHTTAFATPVVEHWLQREIAQYFTNNSKTYKYPSRKGTLAAPQNTCMYFQFGNSQPSNARRTTATDQYGSAPSNGRHLSTVNSRTYGYDEHRIMPQHAPIRNLRTPNISQATENGQTKFRSECMRIAKKRIFFRPNESETWPVVTTPTSIPAIWIDVMVFVTHFLSHTRSH